MYCHQIARAIARARSHGHEDVGISSSWTGGGHLPTGEDGLRQVEIATAIERAAETGDVVHLGVALTV
jgi:predicted dehydrogenase